LKKPTLNDLHLERTGFLVEKKTLPVQAKVSLATPGPNVSRIAGNPGSRNGIRIDEVTAAACAA
jgi:hypothetical protein